MKFSVLNSFKESVLKTEQKRNILGGWDPRINVSEIDENGNPISSSSNGDNGTDPDFDPKENSTVGG